MLVRLAGIVPLADLGMRKKDVTPTVKTGGREAFKTGSTEKQ